MVKYLILDSAIEDVTGLYEVIWELNSKYPNVEKSEKIEVARIAIQNLLVGGHLSLYKKLWNENKAESIEESDFREIIAQDKNWDPPGDNGIFYCFFETPLTYDELWKLYERLKNPSQQQS